VKKLTGIYTGACQLLSRSLCLVAKATFPLPIRSTRPNRLPKFPIQARPLLGWDCTRLVPNQVHWCMVK